MPTTVIEYSYYSLSDAVVLQVYEMFWQHDVVKIVSFSPFSRTNDPSCMNTSYTLSIDYGMLVRCWLENKEVGHLM